ncbi:TPA: hypothetical protein HA318_04330 [Candidatus Micrarchaeota archaeon]|nr:MAG: hypothetical protein AUJ65_01380 [Candidatus Micrarchaeota archaeon CG1_02_51_15]HII39199.1 hypothetical protein [Candidatus Micrarchaeota archaeon]
MSDETKESKPHAENNSKTSLKEKVLKWGVILIIVLFVVELFFVVMYPTQAPGTDGPDEEKPREFDGNGFANAKILSFTSDLYVICNETSGGAGSAVGAAVNQSAAIALSDTPNGKLYYLKLSSANLSNAETIDAISENTSGICSGGAIVMRQANIQFTEPLTLINPANTSQSATLSAYALRDGVKGLVIDAFAQEGDESGFSATAKMLGTTVLQFAAQQTSAGQAPQVERKTGMVTARVISLKQKGMAIKQYAWEERNNITAEAIEANLSGFNASVDYRKSDLLEVPISNETNFTSLNELQFVLNLEEQPSLALLTVESNYSNKTEALELVSKAANVSEDRIGFYSSTATIMFNFTQDANFTMLIEELKGILGNDTEFKRLGVVSPTNVSTASESLGFQVPSEFEALLSPTKENNTVAIVFVTALARNGKLLALTAEDTS